MRTAMKRMTMVGAALLLHGGLGCGATPPEGTVRQRAAGDDAAGELVARAPDRGTVRGGERMRRTVAWPDAGTRDLAAYEGFDASSRAAIDAAPVPVLVPGPEVALDQRQVMHGPEWYAFWGRREATGDGTTRGGTTVTISLQASRMARVYPGVRPMPGTHTLRGQEAFLTRNEGIWTGSWIEHGVAYALGIECAPVDAPPCDDERELEALAEGLRLVGGQGLLASASTSKEVAR
jgi:hypothetical protein